ncbi:hypothetical protein CY0110_17482 [Crocosphaera chwakensis CCY0110]|uniref:Uncharacterized protein n=1 Tax=Crocosphaera chwakensis CCY0110 TaxID=391612 RepID=A3IIH8_9CHRO|nr:hypothetical protein CY0110_17482 [Crocosphaera chwakensis CCY0110]
MLSLKLFFAILTQIVIKVHATTLSRCLITNL